MLCGRGGGEGRGREQEDKRGREQEETKFRRRRGFVARRRHGEELASFSSFSALSLFRAGGFLFRASDTALSEPLFESLRPNGRAKHSFRLLPSR